MPFQVPNRCIQIAHGERQVPQPARLGVAGPRRRVREAEQLDLRAVGQLEVEFVRSAGFPVHLGKHLQAEHLDVEPFRPLVVRADHSDVVRAMEERQAVAYVITGTGCYFGGTEKQARWPSRSRQ